VKSLFTFLFILITINSQEFNPLPSGGGEYEGYKNETPCLSEENRQLIIDRLKDNEAILKSQNLLAYNGERNVPNPLFIWPIRKANGVEYNDVWGISGYVDHDVNSGVLLDYNCVTTTYDTPTYNHQGLDVFTWPFGLKMMDNDQVEIIAASDGQIIDKGDGEYDRSCDFNTNVWNAVYVQHNDGSVAWYGHMKNGSVTSKNIGDMVTQGELLGVVGSSGNSTGPHLHFEIWEDSSYTNLIDPYDGTCNDWNSESWWANQKPYKNPNINAALTHTDIPVFNCPTTELTYEEGQFDESQLIHFTIFLRDQAAGTSINLRLIKPDNTDLYNWNYDLTSDFVASWWRWNFNTLDISGEWKWEITYLGQTVTHTLNVGTLSVNKNELPNTSIYPNPFENIVEIKSESKITEIVIRDLLGKTITIEKNDVDGLNYIDNSTLSSGVYLMTLKDNLERSKTIKLIKK
jgi:murein DD-endopeptidase MepM/ murein hydrolase activator NlpD